MASNKRTIYLGLDYSQFTGGVTEINRKMALLDAEFKRATQEAKNYGTETDQLALKEEYLTQKIALQNQKVEDAKNAYYAALDSKTASEKEIDNLDKKLLEEITRLEKLKGELIQNQEETDKANGINKTFGDTIRSVASVLGLNVSPALQAAAKKFDSFSSAAGNTVLIIGALITTLSKWGIETAKRADDLSTLSAKTGVSVEMLQRFDYASELVDVSTDTLANSLSKLTINMGKAKDGSNDTAEAFKKLHVRIKDNRGQLRDSLDVWKDCIDALGKVRNETERDVLANQIFGKSFTELKPLVEAGTDTLNQYMEEANIMSDKQIANGVNLSNAWERLNKSFEAVKETLSEFLIPVLEKVASIISEIPTPVLAIIAIGVPVVALIFQLVAAIGTLTTAVAVHNGVQTIFNATSLKSILIIFAIVAALITLGVVIAAIIGETDKMNESMDKANKMASDIGTTADKLTDKANTTSRNARGTDYFSGGKTWIAEEGPELVELPRGSRITPVKDTGYGSEVNNYYITIDAKNVQDFNRVVDLAQQQRMGIRRT